MTGTTMDVLVAGYQNIDAARHDFDAVVALIRGKKVKVEGAILVSHDQDGSVAVLSTGDHLGRKGLGWGAGVGLVVGLFNQSVADWSIVPGPKAPEGAPNVLVVLIDDAGFGNPDTFGGVIATLSMTRVQQMGLTHNRFRVTAVCSPTRAALLSGRTTIGWASARSPSPRAVPRLPRRQAQELHLPSPYPQGRTAMAPAGSASGT